MAQVNGGTIAPQRGGRGRGRGRVNPQGRGMMNPPGQGPAGGAQGAQGRGARGNGQVGTGVASKGPGVGGAALPGPGGRQLAARVSSGAITQEQAQKTMQQRQTLAKAFGPDWRDKISGGAGGKSFAQVNAGLKKNPGNAQLAALRKKLLAGRKSTLEAARKKVGGGEGGE